MADQETDVVDDRGGNAVLGVSSLAGAVLACPTAPPMMRELAEGIMQRLGLWLLEGAKPLPREQESIAATWNRHMDVPLDAAIESASAKSRGTRRAMMARALDRADLLLLDRSYLAGLLDVLLETKARNGELEAELQRQGGPLIYVGNLTIPPPCFAAEPEAAGDVSGIDFMEPEPGEDPAKSRVND